MIFWCDFETRSPVDLRTHGAYAYVRQAEVICMSYAFNDDEVQTWRPGTPFPEIGRAQIRAHNAAFERLVFWHVLDMRFPIEQFYCTAAQARANCMPGSLEDVGRFCGASMRKDHRGAALVRKFCIPPYSEDDPAELIEYCEQDVRAMRAVSKAMRPLSPDELADYHVSERINDRGVRLDVPLALAAMQYAKDETVDIEARVREVTEGAVNSVRSPKMREWVLARVTDEQRALMVNGEKVSIDKAVRANLLACDDLDPDVREVVQAADDIWASSVAKFARLAALADVRDHRVRGAFVFAGGAATGRFASYGAQVHNFTRKVHKDPETVRRAMVRGHALVPQHGPRVSDVLRSMLRPSLIPADGSVFIVADWSSIEARVTPWLAGPSGDIKLNVFRSGRDPYIVNATGAFRVPYNEVTDGQRQIGKVMELACGFAGGAGAFAAMGRAYGLRLPENEAKRMVSAWRRVNAWAPAFWDQLEGAYLRAMRNPGHEFTAGRITYLYDGQHLWYALPSGRVLCYPYARLEAEGVSYAKCSWKPMADATEWPRGRLWKGLACIAKGTPVLTHRGWIEIEKVLATDLVWDGEEWVEHDGVAHQGVRRVAPVFGVDMTADHLVLTDKGWVRAGKAQGHTRAACRIPDGYELARHRRQAVYLGDYVRLLTDAGNEAARLHEAGKGSPYSVMRMPEARASSQSALDARDDAAPSVRGVAQHERPVPHVVASRFCELRRAWHYCVRGMAGLVYRVLGRHGADVSDGANAGARQQRRGLFARELSLGNAAGAGAQHTQVPNGRQPAWPDVGLRVIGANRDRADDASVSAVEGGDGRSLDFEAGRYSEVFDLINCGPRRRFVVMGEDGAALIVHNCENATQATAADILRHSLRRLSDVVLHVHDEIVIEVPRDRADPAHLIETMTTAPAWAEGLPLACAAKVMTRYGK